MTVDQVHNPDTSVQLNWLAEDINPLLPQSVSACHAEGEGSQLLTDVAEALTDLWGQHARSPRLATPILRTAEVLLSQTHILALEKDLSHTLGKCPDASCLFSLVLY